MKKNLCKNKKQHSRLKVVFYAAEGGGVNYSCLINSQCDVVVNC
jgi:hypothetical protein